MVPTVKSFCLISLAGSIGNPNLLAFSLNDFTFLALEAKLAAAVFASLTVSLLLKIGLAK
jgi:hypothetical protein